jgi:hypothetical protein
VLEDAYRGETSSKVLNKEQAAFKRDREQFLMKDALSRAAPILQKFRTRFDRSVLDSEGNVGEIRRIKWRMQTALKGILSETIPHYRRYRSTEKSHIRRTYSSLRDQFRGAIATGVDARLGEHVTVDQKNFQHFLPEYDIFDVTTHDVGNTVVYDHSFVDPKLGFLVNNIRTRHNEDAWLPTYNPVHWVFAEVSLGVEYQVPQTGYLTCMLSVQNAYNKISYSVKDNFGFSYAHLNIVHSIFIDIIRTGERTRFHRIMVDAGLISHGADLSYSTSEIQNSTPYTISITTKDAFLKGERIQVMGGSYLFIGSELDDMESSVDAVLWWQLKKMSIGV